MTIVTVLHYAEEFYNHQFDGDITDALMFLKYIKNKNTEENKSMPDNTVSIHLFFENLPEIDPFKEDY